MEPTLKDLRNNYERFSDEKLIRIATEEASELRPEAVELLKQIIAERGLSQDVLKGMSVQMNGVDDQTLQKYKELLRTVECPYCSSSAQKLNATMTATAVGLVIFSTYETELKIACPPCLDHQHKRAMIKSALLGLWAFPGGIIKTVKSLIFNRNMKKKNHSSEASEFFDAFISERAGRIESNLNNPEELKAIIKYIR